MLCVLFRTVPFVHRVVDVSVPAATPVTTASMFVASVPMSQAGHGRLMQSYADGESSPSPLVLGLAAVATLYVWLVPSLTRT